MNDTRIWLIGSVLLSVVILAGGWFLGVSPMLALAATAESDRVAVEAQNQQFELNLADLQVRYEDLPEVERELEELRVALPVDADVSAFLRSIQKAAEETEVVVASIDVADGLPYLPVLPEPVVAPVPAPTAEAADGAEAAAAVDAAAPAPALVSSVAPIPFAEFVTADNFVAVPVSVSATGSLEQVMAFVAGMQAGERLYLVTALNVAEDPTSGGFSVDLSGYIWTLLDADSGAIAPVDPVLDSATATN